MPIAADSAPAPIPLDSSMLHRQGINMQVAIPLFPRFTALDAIGPYEVLQRIPTIDVTDA